MSKKILIIMTIITLIIFTSCQPLQKRGDTKETMIGTKALSLLFRQNLPPKTIIEETPFTVLVDIHNEGASEISNGIYVLGFENQYVDFTNNKGALRIEGKTSDNPTGGLTTVELIGKTNSLGPQLEGLTTQLSFTACFPYTTNAEFTTCIDTSPEQRDKIKECSVATKTSSTGQGAPIVITKIEPMMNKVQNGVQPVFRISIKNMGGGQILDPEYTGQYCLGRTIPSSAYQIVQAKAYLLEDELTCTKTQLKIAEKEETILCTSPKIFTKREGTFPVPLRIELTYGYAQTITQDMRIESKT